MVMSAYRKYLGTSSLRYSVSKRTLLVFTSRHSERSRLDAPATQSKEIIFGSSTQKTKAMPPRFVIYLEQLMIVHPEPRHFLTHEVLLRNCGGSLGRTEEEVHVYRLQVSGCEEAL